MIGNHSPKISCMSNTDVEFTFKIAFSLMSALLLYLLEEYIISCCAGVTLLMILNLKKKEYKCR